MISLFKVDKKYFQLNTTYQLLLSDGWQFIELSGKYNGLHYAGSDPSHKGQFPFYSYAIERIRMKQIEDEYYKAPEQQQSSGGESLIPPTPAGYLNAARIARQDSQQEINGRPRTTIGHQPSTGGAAATIYSAIQTQGATATVLPRIDEASEGRRQDE